MKRADIIYVCPIYYCKDKVFKDLNDFKDLKDVCFMTLIIRIPSVLVFKKPNV